MIFEQVVSEIARREDAEEQAAIDARQAAWDLIKDAVIADLKSEAGPPIDDLIEAVETLGHEAPSLMEIKRALNQVQLGGGISMVANWNAEDIRVREIENQRLKDDEWQAIVIRREVLTQAAEGWRTLAKMFDLTDRLLLPYVTDSTRALTKLVGPPYIGN